MQPTNGRSSPIAADKGKDKEQPPPAPYTDLYSEAMAYDDDEYASDYETNTVNEAKARDSLAYRQMTALLSGTSLSVLNALSSSFVEGRVVDIHPYNTCQVWETSDTHQTPSDHLVGDPPWTHFSRRIHFRTQNFLIWPMECATATF
jgi:hypothetical protein